LPGESFFHWGYGEPGRVSAKFAVLSVEQVRADKLLQFLYPSGVSSFLEDDFAEMSLGEADSDLRSRHPGSGEVRTAHMQASDVVEHVDS
jgi:hypothetical protein